MLILIFNNDYIYGFPRCLCMSCRVLHRGVEEALLAKVSTDAEEQGLEQAWITGSSSPFNV